MMEKKNLVTRYFRENVCEKSFLKLLLVKTTLEQQMHILPNVIMLVGKVLARWPI